MTEGCRHCAVEHLVEVWRCDGGLVALCCGAVSGGVTEGCRHCAVEQLVEVWRCGGVRRVGGTVLWR